MSETPDLGPLPQRITVEAEQVRRLVADQFPRWADLPVEPVADGGWDNWTFHLGPERLVRLPSAAEYAVAVDKEHRWLPALAPMLPLPIPAPLAKGELGAGYPYPWSVYRWLDGEPASREGVADPVRFALDLAEFLAALQSVDAVGGPQPGIHGDIAQGNLLLAGGRLAAVIDFGTCGVGDPACDLAIAWTLLTADGREAFRERLSVDDATWARGRGWALWKTLATCSYNVEDPEDAQEFANAQRVLGEIFSEDAASAVTRPEGIQRAR